MYEIKSLYCYLKYLNFCSLQMTLLFTQIHSDNAVSFLCAKMLHFSAIFHYENYSHLEERRGELAVRGCVVSSCICIFILHRL
jgi:hypothetical protein